MPALTHTDPVSDELTPAELYLDLLKKCLTRSIFPERFRPVPRRTNPLARLAGKWLASRELAIVSTARFDAVARAEGLDWPAEAETMIGLRRLQNLQDCIVDVVENGVAGDLIETGVWRGGATIFMRGVLKALGDRERTVWVADSFAGLPRPSPHLYPQDRRSAFHWYNDILEVSLEEVKANFARYGLLDDQVKFLPGWFSDTLPSAPIERLAVLRLDGDMYESTIVALRSLYPKLSLGGYVIIDDYTPEIATCVQAVEDFRRALGISEEMHSTGKYGVYWQRIR